MSPGWHPVCRSHKSHYGCSLSTAAHCQWQSAPDWKWHRPPSGQLSCLCLGNFPQLRYILFTQHDLYFESDHFTGDLRTSGKSSQPVLKGGGTREGKPHRIYIDNWRTFFFFFPIAGKIVGCCLSPFEVTFQHLAYAPISSPWLDVVC